MATRDAINEEVERLRKVVQRDELNFVEHVIGIAGERVPKNKATGQEITSIRVERSIQDMNGLTVDGFWEVTGDPNHGGLPRGYDLDLFTADHGGVEQGRRRQRLISVGSLYKLLQLTGRDAQTRSYRRLRAGLDRLYGVSINAYATIYDPGAKRTNQEQVPALQQHGARRDPGGRVPPRDDPAVGGVFRPPAAAVLEAHRRRALLAPADDLHPAALPVPRQAPLPRPGAFLRALPLGQAHRHRRRDAAAVQAREAPGHHGAAFRGARRRRLPLRVPLRCHGPEGGQGRTPR